MVEVVCRMQWWGWEYYVKEIRLTMLSCSNGGWRKLSDMIEGWIHVVRTPISLTANGARIRLRRANQIE